jgi:hypothetical protein
MSIFFFSEIHNLHITYACTCMQMEKNNLVNMYFGLNIYVNYEFQKKMETTEEVRFCKIILILLFSFMGNHQSVRFTPHWRFML